MKTATKHVFGLGSLSFSLLFTIILGLIFGTDVDVLLPALRHAVQSWRPVFAGAFTCLTPDKSLQHRIAGITKGHQMPIPGPQQIHVEAVLNGAIAAGGSGNVLTANVFHFRRTSTVAVLSKAAFDTAFQAAIAVPLAACLNARWGQTRNDVRIIDDANDAYVPFAHVVAGAIAGESMESYATAFILLKTGLRGKNYRGSKKIGPFSESDTTTPNFDVFNAGAIGRLNTLITALGTPFVDANGNTWNLQVFSTSLSQVRINPTNVVANDVTTIALNTRVSTLIKRKRKSVY